jgi:hypothetical protein
MSLAKTSFGMEFRRDGVDGAANALAFVIAADGGRFLVAESPCKMDDTSSDRENGYGTCEDDSTLVPRLP